MVFKKVIQNLCTELIQKRIRLKRSFIVLKQCWRDDAKVIRFLFVKIETDSLESSEATDGNVSWISRPQSYTVCICQSIIENIMSNKHNVSATIICNGRPALTRKAKYLIKLLKSLVPEDTLDYIECEFCSEARYNQNLMAEAVFTILVDSLKPISIEDSRLSLKVNELAHMLISYIDPFRLSRNE